MTFKASRRRSSSLPCQAASAASAASFIPGKINNFLIKRRGVDPTAMMKWMHEQPDWADLLKSAVRDRQTSSLLSRQWRKDEAPP